MQTIDEHALLDMGAGQLDDLFAASPSGPLPDGATDGVALLAPGYALNRTIAQTVRILAWQGKTFYRAHGILTNRITPLGLPSVVAFVYEAASWFDGRSCIVLDYSRTSLIARFIRDEIRLIAPTLYLGRVYLAGRYVFGFALRCSAAASSGLPDL